MTRNLLTLILIILSLTTYGQWPIHVEAETPNLSSDTIKGPNSVGGQSLYFGGKFTWAQYIINIPKDSMYKFTARVAGEGNELVITDSAWNVLGRLTFPSTTSDQSYSTLSTYLFLKAGNRRIRITARNADFNLNWIEIDQCNLFYANDYESDWRWFKRGTLPWRATRADSTVGGWIKQTARAESLVISSEYARKGKSSLKFELAKSDSAIWPYVRSEIYFPAPEKNFEEWYGFSFMCPVTLTGDGNRHIFIQWHGWDDPGESARSPCIGFEVENDSIKVKVLWASMAIQANGNNDKDGEIVYNLGKFYPYIWNDFVMHVRWSYTNTGILEIWRDGVKVVNRINLPNWYNDQNLPYLKMGIYKWPWKGGGVINGTWQWWSTLSPYNVLTHYYDCFKVGGPNSSYAEVAP